jgi:acyl-CoA thioesterase-1
LQRAGWLLLGTLLLGASASSQEALVVALGDSNTAGFGVGAGQAFPAHLEVMLRQRGHDVRVFNAGRPGDTFGGMLARLDSSVPSGTRLVIVQGGYNDVVVRTPPDRIVAAMQGILARLKARHADVVLCGFFYPDWDAVGRSLAASFQATFVDGSACYDPGSRGPDGLHMAAAGHQVVAARLASVVDRLLSPRMTAGLRRGGRQGPEGAQPGTAMTKAEAASAAGRQSAHPRAVRQGQAGDRGLGAHPSLGEAARHQGRVRHRPPVLAGRNA